MELGTSIFELNNINKRKYGVSKLGFISYDYGKRKKSILSEQGDFESTFYLATVNTCHQIYFTKNTGNEHQKANVNREDGKTWWSNVCRNWDNEQFCEKFRINRQTFNFILKYDLSLHCKHTNQQCS